MSATAAARSVLRPSFAVRPTAATRLAAGIKPKPASFSPLRVPKQQRPMSLRISRSPVELSCCVETLLPYHTATASALLNSMLSVSRHTYGWILDDCNDDV